jgi:hypothetical protein
MQRVTLDTGMTSMWNIPANANRNKVNSNQGKSHKASNGIIKNILQFFGFKK